MIDDLDELQGAHEGAPEVANALIAVTELLVEQEPRHKRAAVLITAASHVRPIRRGRYSDRIQPKMETRIPSR